MGEQGISGKGDLGDSLNAGGGLKSSSNGGSVLTVANVEGTGDGGGRSSTTGE
jgi:hypothetical protein